MLGVEHAELARWRVAAAVLIRASAPICAGSSGVPEIGKFSTARWVWARQSASAGTRTSPMRVVLDAVFVGHSGSRGGGSEASRFVG